MQNRMWSITTSGWVKSTTTWAPASAMLNSQSPSSTIATSSRSSAALTAFTTSVPIRPRAPSTPTLMHCSSPGEAEVSGAEGELVVTRSDFPAAARGARQGPMSGRPDPSAGASAGEHGPEEQAQQHADGVREPVADRAVPLQGGDG